VDSPEFTAGHLACSGLGGPTLAKARKVVPEPIGAAADNHAANVLPIIREIRKAGATSLREIADALNARGVQTARATARAADLTPVLNELRGSGITSLGGIARARMERGIPSARGRNEWTAMQVARTVARLESPV
jgi:hypothetical protein